MSDMFASRVKASNRSMILGLTCLILVVPMVILLDMSPSASFERSTTDNKVEVLARTDQVTITREGDWTYYKFATPLENAVDHTYYGTSDGNGGCSFKGEETVQPLPSGVVMEERETASNLKTCVMVTESGIQTERVSEPDGQISESRARDTAKPNDGRRTRAGARSALLYSRAAWHRTEYNDPAAIDVNASKTRLSWNYNGSCVIGSWDHGVYYTWLSGTGWSMYDDSFDAGLNCQYARSTSFSDFKNKPFCDPNALTFTGYAPNEIRGKFDGSYSMRWEPYKTGDCDFLLWFDRQWGNT